MVLIISDCVVISLLLLFAVLVCISISSVLVISEIVCIFMSSVIPHSGLVSVGSFEIPKFVSSDLDTLSIVVVPMLLSVVSAFEMTIGVKVDV